MNHHNTNHHNLAASPLPSLSPPSLSINPLRFENVVIESCSDAPSEVGWKKVGRARARARATLNLGACLMSELEGEFLMVVVMVL
jgi:hypothetical protein